MAWEEEEDTSFLEDRNQLNNAQNHNLLWSEYSLLIWLMPDQNSGRSWELRRKSRNPQEKFSEFKSYSTLVRLPPKTTVFTWNTDQMSELQISSRNSETWTSKALLINYITKWEVTTKFLEKELKLLDTLSLKKIKWRWETLDVCPGWSKTKSNILYGKNHQEELTRNTIALL